MVSGNWTAISATTSRRHWQRRRQLAFRLLPLLMLTLSLGPAAADEGELLVRELLVPFEDLHVVLKEGGRRVFLNRDEYEDLLAKASVSQEELAPQAVTIIATEYEGRLDGQRAIVRGRILVEVTAGGLHAIDLPLVGAGVMNATLDGRPAALSRPDDGCAQLFVEGRGRHELTIDLVVPAKVAASQQTLHFQLPQAGAGHFRLSVDGDVELKSGAAVLRRDQADGRTIFEFPLLKQVTSLVLNLNNRQADDQRIVVARTVLVDELTETYERLHLTAAMQIPHGNPDRFRFTIPADFEITNVQTPRLSRWQVVAEADESVLEIQLREGAASTEVLHITAQRNAPNLSSWTMQTLRPLEVAGTVTVVGLLVEDGLETRSLKTNGMIPVDVQSLTSALPPSVLESEPGAPKITPVASFFSPDGQVNIAASLVRPPARLEVSSTQLLTLRNSGLDLSVGVSLLPQARRTFGCNLLLDGGWRVNWVRQDGQHLDYETHAADDGRTRVEVKFPAGIVPGGSVSFRLNATLTPATWLDNWQTQGLEFPGFDVLEASTHSGAIAVQVEDDLRVQDDATTGLLPLDANEKSRYGLQDVTTQLAFEFEDTPHTATLTVQRLAARITAETYSFLNIEPGHLLAHYELAYKIADARTDEVSFYLPAETPDEIKIDGLHGLSIKGSSRSEVERGQLWTIKFGQPIVGTATLKVEFEQVYDSARSTGSAVIAESLALPLIEAAGVQYQTGSVSVEANPELDVTVATAARKIDVGELIDAQYRPGRHLLGAYGFVGEPAGVSVRVTRPPQYGLPAAIIQRGELVSSLSTGGISQTAVRFLLRTKAQFLEVQLPNQSTLWSVYLDGSPAKPQRNAERLLISLPADNTGLRDLQLVYESTTQSVQMWGSLEVRPPELFLRNGTDQPGLPVPMAELSWHVALPAGYRLVASDGTVFPDFQDYRTRRQLADRLTAAEATVVSIGGVRRSAMAAAGEAMVAQKHANSTHAASDMALPRAASEVRARSLDEGLQEMDEAETQGLFDDAPDVDGEREERAGDPFRADVPQLAQATPREATQSELARDQIRNSSRGGAYWALEGLRSLRIDLATGEHKLAFRSLGANPILDLTLVDGHRLNLLAWAGALFVVALGLMLAGRSLKAKLRYVLAVLLLATILPIALGWQRELGRIMELAFYAGLTLIPLYVLLGCARRLQSWMIGRTVATATVFLVSLVSLATSLRADETEAQVGPITVKLIGPTTPVTIPKDVVIVPYDPASETGTGPERVIVPYEKYVELWDLAFPHRQLADRESPAEASWAGAVWSATLSDEESLLIEGVIELDTFVDRLVAMPFAFSGGVLEKATLDGQSARIASADSVSKPASRRAQATAIERPGSFLLVSAKGRHRLELSLRYPLQRRGGWRVVDGRLPNVPASTFSIRVPQQQTELRITAQQDLQTFETTQPNETIATSLGLGGKLQLQWRPKIAIAEVDRSLTVKSDAVVDVQEDSVSVDWRLDFLFPRAARDSFSLVVPSDYLVESVAGENIRTWERTDQLVEVRLLSPVRDRQRLTLRLARRGAIGQGDLRQIQVPVMEVPDAVLHEGRLATRRSPLLSIRTLATEGLVRTSLTSVEMAQNKSSESPLGIRPYQAYRFGRTPYRLQFAVTPVDAKVTAEVQSLVRALATRRSLEARILLQPSSRPVYQVDMRLPASFELKSVDTTGTFQTATSDNQDGTRQLSVYLGNGQAGEFAIVLRGELGAEQSAGVLTLPHIQVSDVAKQSTTIVVQTDPSYDARAERLQGCDQVLLDRAYDWLGVPQRKLARLAIHSDLADFSGSIRLTRRAARVDCRTVSNLRVTPRAFEETVLLDFTIYDAGVREVSFLLPAYMRDARISVPLLRRKLLEDVSADQVRVRVELLDEVVGQLRVLVEQDRLVSSEERTVPIPSVETGRTNEQFVALESAGRDEVAVVRTEDVVSLGRQQRQWRVLAELLGENVTQAFLVENNAPAPQLVVRTVDRQGVDTVGARIAFAETLLVVDASGTYRGTQTYQVDNRTEPFLDLVMPPDAQLWTANVAGRPIKPISGDGIIRIPLVRTAEGDQDYTVRLKYGGQFSRFAALNTVNFPFIRTQNIEAEQSQVRLRLPETHRWFGFGGSLRRVDQEDDLIAGFLKYKTDQLFASSSGLASKNPYARARSLSNLKDMVSILESRQLRDFRQSGNKKLVEQLDALQRAGETAKRQLGEETQDGQIRQEYVSNSGRLNALYAEQTNQYARKATDQMGSNFDVAADVKDADAQPKEGKLQKGWLKSNSLSNEISGKQLGDRINLESAPQRKSVDKFQERLDLEPSSGGYGGGDSDYGAGSAARDAAGGGYGGGYGGGGGGYGSGYGGGGGFGAGGRGQGRYENAPTNQAAAIDSRQLGSSVDRVWRFQQQLGQQQQVPDQAFDFNQASAGSDRPLGRQVQADANQIVTGAGLTDLEVALDEPPPAARGGLASLDVELPTRGREYLFTTPRGEVQVTGRFIDAAIITRIRRLAIVLGVCLAVGLLYRLLASWTARTVVGTAAS